MVEVEEEQGREAVWVSEAHLTSAIEAAQPNQQQPPPSILANPQLLGMYNAIPH